ncbi:MAG: SOS response-associated peptidase [Fibrobacterales bacterium]
MGMCGRFALTSSPAELARQFNCLAELSVNPQYTIGPMDQVAVVKSGVQSLDRTLTTMQWWLVPSFVKGEPEYRHAMFNARAETLSVKPSFKSNYQKRRCIIPADAFYEWKDGQPYAFRMADHTPFGMAGLWDEWQGSDGSILTSCTIITTEANDLVKPIHDKQRMPVILDPREYDVWLDSKSEQNEQLDQLLNPFESDRMECYPVTKDLKQNSSICLEALPVRVQDGEQLGLFG